MSQPTFEQQAIAMIAAELPISVVFLRKVPGGVGVRVSRVSPKNFEDLDVALFALIDPPCVAPFEVSQAAFHDFARTGLMEHDRGFVVLLAEDYALPKKPENLRSWVNKMSAAWEVMVADHVSQLNSTGTVAAPRKEYLAARFSTDETNLWLLAEESGEVIRGCGKIGRWGYDHVHQVTGESGMRLLEAEVGDFLAIVDIMVARGHFTAEALEAAKQAKLKRLEDWYEAPWAPADLAQPVGAIEPATGRPCVVDAVDWGGPGTKDHSVMPMADPPAPVFELPLSPEGGLGWKALDGDLVTVKQGADGLTVEVTKNGRVQVFSGVLAKPIHTHTNP